MSKSRRRQRLALACTLLVGAGAAAGFSGIGDDSPAEPAKGETRPSSTASRPDDAEAADASPLPAGAPRGPAAPSPTRAGARGEAQLEAVAEDEQGVSISPGAPSDAEVRAELKAMQGVQREARRGTLAGPAGIVKLGADGTARVPADAPKKVAAIIASANAIARFPYVYGGGHGSFVDTAYDCSGSVSYALAGAKLMTAPLASGGFEEWGEPGPGKWITIYTNPGHMFMTVGGVRYDTSGRSGVLGSRWNATPRSVAGFTVRHPKGL